MSAGARWVAGEGDGAVGGAVAGQELGSASAGAGVLDLVEEAGLRRPVALREWARLIEGCLAGGVRGGVAVPIRHHKTTTTLYGIAWLLWRNPRLRIIGMCADHERATELAKSCRQICEGVSHTKGANFAPKRGDNIILDWKNESGGGVVWMSAEQSKLGRDVDVLICDDPITEKTADDPLVRNAVDHAIALYTARAGRPGHPGSVLIVMSRWHPDDPIGRRILRQAAQWTIIQHPAIEGLGTANETAFDSEIMPIEVIRSKREEMREEDPTERVFWAQFQNNPLAATIGLFGEPARYGALPTYGGYRTAYGVDAAFSRQKNADWFALAALRWYGSDCYVLGVTRFRASYEDALANIAAYKEQWGPGPIYSYMSGPEIGSIPLYATQGVAVQALPARFDKRTRSQTTIRIWNVGRVLWPEAPWVAPVMQRFQLFRGLDGDSDDEVDAFVSAFDGSNFSSATNPTRSLGAWRF
jgi:phage terminase large subunit-like protein